jgi:hypothetical protein
MIIRRPVRPTFNSTQEQILLNALQEARRMVIKCGNAERFGSARYQRCNALAQSIDALAEELTGRRGLFQPAPSRH